MPKKKPTGQGKTRPREHILADLSINFVERRVFLEGFAVERFTRDYGLDLVMTTFADSGEVIPGRVVLQVKATDSLEILADGQTISFSIEREHLKAWLHETDVVILIVYDGAKDCAYWLYVQAWFEGRSSADWFSQKSVSVHIPMSNRMDRRAIRKFRDFHQQLRKQITQQIHRDV